MDVEPLEKEREGVVKGNIVGHTKDFQYWYCRVEVCGLC
jgi:hypothetical protein